MPLLTNPLVRRIALGALIVVSVAANWLFIQNLKADNAALQVKVEQLAAEKRQAERNSIALADQLVTVQARAVETSKIKEAIREAPSGPVPADIRAALERLRDH